MLLKIACLLGCVFLMVHADTYLHYPRGSNNRLREKSANRNNGNRVFDSQNNNRGGYNVGIKEAGDDGNQESEQYQQEYFQSGKTSKTFMPIRWTSQHGSGGDEDAAPNKMNANFVIQAMFQESNVNGDTTRMRDGTSQQTQEYRQPRQMRYNRELRKNVVYESQKTFEGRRGNGVKKDRVLQEPFEWYDKCKVRERNKGLFTADQNVKRQDATGTRQNPNGNRRGYECPEERDHFPYWHPTPWVDVMVYSKNTSMCAYYKKHSFNTATKCMSISVLDHFQAMYY